MNRKILLLKQKKSNYVNSENIQTEKSKLGKSKTRNILQHATSIVIELKENSRPKDSDQNSFTCVLPTTLNVWDCNYLSAIGQLSYSFQIN